MNELDIFAAVLELDGPGREKYLDEACGEDPELRKRIQVLLRSSEKATSFMESPPEGVGGAPSFDLSDTKKPGTEIGPYKLREKIGEGGFGAVYVAEQTKPVRRKVALKIIKPGMDSKEVIARFEAERQALALMNHPNIARVLDAGATEQGHPYFVMELVQGLPITEFCDKNKLPTRDRLELFLNVSQAVHHAHQKGIIHRDLKPSNIMVTLHDGDPVPKVIDFGVAKALSQQLTEKTIYTSYGQVIGTPQYMSPEQAEMSGLGIDTRSDIYSLGVLLYELLTGTSPVDKQRLLASGYAEMMRIIREEEPPRPSKRISTLGQEATAIAQHRRTDGRKLSRALQGELDWIVMKSLEKDRERRYDTAANFAADIKRFLDDEVVQACPPSTSYRLRKFARRNPALVGMAIATTIVLMLVAGMLASLAYQGQLALANTRLQSANDKLTVTNSELGEAQDSLQRAQHDLERSLYFRRISRALSAWYDNNMREVRSLLDACPTSQRNWEWQYVDGLLHRSEGVFDAGTADADDQELPNEVAFSPDGTSFIGGSTNSTVKIWDTRTHRELATIADATSPVAFSPDATWCVAASAAERGVMKVFNIDERLAHEYRIHDELITDVSINADGQRIATAARDGIRVWDVKGGTVLFANNPKEKQTGFWNWVTFSPNGKHLAMRSGLARGERDDASERRDGFGVSICDADSGEELFRLKGQHNRLIFDAAYSQDGKLIVTGGWDETIKIWDADTGRELNEFWAHEHYVQSVTISNDGKRVFSGGYDRMIKAWSVATGRELFALKGHTDDVECVALSPDDRLIVSASDDDTIRIWRADDSQDSLLLSGHFATVQSVAFSPDGTRVVSGSDDGSVRVWPLDDERQLLLANAQTDVNAVAFSSDGKLVFSAGGDNAIRIWDATTLGILKELSGHEPDQGGHGIRDLAASADGRWLASAGSDRTVRLWDLSDVKSDREPLILIGHTAQVSEVDFSPDGSRIVSGAIDGGLRAWDVPSGRAVFALELPVRVESVDFTPDGRRFAVGCYGQKLEIRTTATGELVKTLLPAGRIRSVDFSPDGKRLALSSDPRQVTVWDVESGDEALALRGHTGEVFSVSFSQDGRKLVSSSEDGTIRIWDAGTSEFISTAN